jgi:hypothetical protein
MQDMRALRNSRSLKSWRAWEQEAYRRSGFTAIFMIFALMASFVVPVAIPIVTSLHRRAPRLLEPVVLTGSGLYLAAIFGLMAFAVLRLQAWRRANPWTPPEPTQYAHRGGRLRPQAR